MTKRKSSAPPIREKVKGLRQRQRSDQSWRAWWEPTAAEKVLGFEPVQLDPDRPTWSINKAHALNDEVCGARGSAPRARPRADGRSMAGLIAQYRQSHHFTDKAAATRRSYTTNLNAIERKWGAWRVIEFNKPGLNTWYETLRATSGNDYARQLIGMMSILFSHAELIGWRPENSNPCFRLKMRSGTDRDRAASWAEFDALLDAADQLGMPAMACAIGLAITGAQRQKQIVEARVDAFREAEAIGPDGPMPCLSWEFIRSKRNNYGITPVHPEIEPRVRALLDAAKDGQTFLFLDHATGRPFSGDLFRKRWATIRAAAARTTPSLLRAGNALQFRDLRRTFGVWARAGGASKGDIGDVLGNSAAINPQLGEVYMPPQFHTAARAMSAIQRPNSNERKKA